jgi:hypothetical protein
VPAHVSHAEVEDYRKQWEAAGVQFGFCLCGCGRRTTPAKQSSRTRNTVKGEPRRYVLGHKPKSDPAQRFWPNVDRQKEDDCWLWTGGTANGFGTAPELLGLIASPTKTS